MTAEIPIGTVAAAKVSTPACYSGEIGVCYGAEIPAVSKSTALFLKRAGLPHFTVDDIAQALKLTGRVSEAVAEYKYANDAQLKADFRAGRFGAAFLSLKA